jgi:hypothetical protein
MPGVLQHITYTSYGYVDPYVEKARNMVPLLDTTVHRIEPYFPPVIKAADHYIDAAQNTAGTQVAMLQGRKAALQGKLSVLHNTASESLQSFFGSMHASAVVFLDRSDSLVDHLLPPDETAEETPTQKEISSALIPRALRLPFKVPVRFTKVVFVKARGLSKAAMFRSSEQKRQLLEFVFHSIHLVTDKVEAVTAPVFTVVSSGKVSASRKIQVAHQSLMDAQQVVVLWVNGRFYVVVTTLRLPELQEWTLTKAANVKQVAAIATTQATQGAYVATARIVGDGRADLIFRKVGLSVPHLNEPSTGWQRVQDETHEVVEEVRHVTAKFA